MSVQVEPCRDREERRPGHPDEPDVLEGFVSESLWERTKRWHLHAPAERIPLTFTAACWPACWLAHRGDMPVQDPAVASALAIAGAAIYWGVHERARAKARRDGRAEPHPRLRAAEAASVAAVIGLWVTLAVIWGPLAGPAHLLTWLYAAGAVGGYRWLRSHHAVKAARARRDAAAELLARKIRWNSIAPRCGLGDYQLQSVTPTYLGEDWLLTSAPGGRRAREVVTAASQAAITEVLMHDLGLEYGTIDLRLTGRPGQVIVGIRHKRPTADGPLIHPLVDPSSPYASWFEDLTIRRPVPVGVIPETGEPLELTVWDEDGGKAIGVYGITGAGKTMLLNDLRSAFVQMDDVALILINGVKTEEKAWEGRAAAVVVPEEGEAPEAFQRRVVKILDWAGTKITDRSRERVKTGDYVFQPTRENPAIVIMVDEIDTVAGIPGVGGDGGQLQFLASKQRDAAVCFILSGQTPRISWIGGTGVRANLSTVVTGLLERQGESRLAVGAENEIPDIGEYSGGQPGFWQVWSTRQKKVLARGRAFKLGNRLSDLQERIIARTDPAARPRLLIPGEVLTGTPAQDRQATETPADTSGIGALRARIAALSATPQSSDKTVPQQSARRAVPLSPGAIPESVPPGVMRALWPLLQDGRKVSSAQLADKIGISKTRAWRHLAALANVGIVEKVGGGTSSGYRLARRAAPAPERRPYVTLADLAKAAHNGQVDCDDEQREVLAKVYEIYHRPASGGDQP
jgi:biotin operon repressor